MNSHKSRGRYLLSKTVNPADPKSKTKQQAALGMFSFSRYMYMYLCVFLVTRHAEHIREVYIVF